MNRTIKIYILFLVLLFIAIIYVDANRPKPVNWSPTYSLKDKIPFGLYVFDNEVKNLLKENSISKVNTTAYEFLEADINYDDTIKRSYYSEGTFLSISNYFNIDEESTKELLNFVQNGNSVFISAKWFTETLEDSLHFKLSDEIPNEKGLNLSMANQKFGKQKHNFIEGTSNSFFSSIDTLTTTVLGYQESNNKKYVNFIKVPYKSGYIYLHTQPTAFTNYHLLKDDHYKYTEKILSYLPKGNVFWLTKGQGGEIISESPMRFILSQPALRYAWYLFLIGMLIFMIFNAKRKQRIIPIIKPLTNTTVDFTKTIGNLYYQEGDHQNLIDKKIIYFLEKIRNEYLIDTSTLDDNFIKKLHQKSVKNIEDIQNVVRLINYHRSTKHKSVESDLLEINTAIEKII